MSVTVRTMSGRDVMGMLSHILRNSFSKAMPITENQLPKLAKYVQHSIKYRVSVKGKDMNLSTMYYSKNTIKIKRRYGFSTHPKNWVDAIGRIWGAHGYHSINPRHWVVGFKGMTEGVSWLIKGERNHGTKIHALSSADNKIADRHVQSIANSITQEIARGLI